jgi:hypothetical protein
LVTCIEIARNDFMQEIAEKAGIGDFRMKSCPSEAFSGVRVVTFRRAAAATPESGYQRIDQPLLFRIFSGGKCAERTPSSLSGDVISRGRQRDIISVWELAEFLRLQHTMQSHPSPTYSMP